MPRVLGPALFVVLAGVAPSCGGTTRDGSDCPATGTCAPLQEAGSSDARDAATELDAPRDAPADVPASHSCVRADGAFTACVKQCGEPDTTESMPATCSNGEWQCAAPLVPAATCAPDSWPSGRLAGCGPWVMGYDCLCPARCVDGAWTCPGCSD